MFNLGDMMGKLQQMRSDMAELKTTLEALTVTAQAGGVTVTANGNKRILSVKIDPTLLGTDPEQLEDLVATAVNRALEAAETAGRDALGKVTQGMMPGMDLGKLGL